MTDPMDQPVTKREQNAAFDAFVPVLMEHISTELEKQLEKQLEKRFEQARIEMVAVVEHMGDTLREEMRQLSKTDLRTIRDDLQHYDDKYKDLPARVDRLEATVFKPAPLKRRRTR